MTTKDITSIPFLPTKIPEHLKPAIHEGCLPLSKQFVPSDEENIVLPSELDDPIGDDDHEVTKGLVHRYKDRALIKVTYLCTSYCRFCFRKYKVGKPHDEMSSRDWEDVITYLENHPQISEVILSGGDPLTLGNEKLFFILEKLQKIPHLQVIRFHTRSVTVNPLRFNRELMDYLGHYGRQYEGQCEKNIWIALHVNTVHELTPEAKDVIRRLRKQGISLVSQSVLLKDVNASKEALVTLFKALVSLGVKPYYLHYPDLAKGTHHLRIPPLEAINLVKSLRGEISGLAIPQLMIDLPRGKGKAPLEYPWWQHDNNESGYELNVESPLTQEKISVHFGR